MTGFGSGKIVSLEKGIDTSDAESTDILVMKFDLVRTKMLMAGRDVSSEIVTATGERSREKSQQL